MSLFKRDSKTIKALRNQAGVSNPRWLLYNAELRYKEATEDTKNTLDTTIWKHIWQQNRALLDYIKTPKPKWRLLPKAAPVPGLNQLASTILAHRGITNNIQNFIDAPLSDLDPIIGEVDRAVDLIMKAMEKDVPITIYGDYDADGITGTALAMSAFRRLGYKHVDYYINTRQQGYALSVEGVKKITSRGHPRLLITVDNGVTAYEALLLAKKRMGVIVTDHHDYKTAPNAHALVHPKHFNTPLAGAGVIYKVIHRLYQRLGRDDMYDFLALASIGTIADMVPMLGENRIIAKHGLERINQGMVPAIKALAQALYIDCVNSEAVAFRIAPIINSYSRLKGDAEPVVEFLLSKDVGLAMPFAKYLIDLNKERQALVEQELIKAKEKISLADKVIIISGNFHSGVIGILAGRIKEKYNRPTIVFSSLNGKLQGSGRSIPGFNLKQALDPCPVIEKHGGHELAAGLTIGETDFDRFYWFMQEQAETLKLESPIVNIDWKLDHLDQKTIDIVEMLEPYGQGFPQPLFLYEYDVRSIDGIKDRHTKINDQCIIWNSYKELIKQQPQKIAVLGSPSINSFNNKVQFLATQHKVV